MRRFELSSTIKAPRGFVFAQMANPENLPKMVSVYKTVRVKGKERGVGDLRSRGRGVWREDKGDAQAEVSSGR